MTDQATTPEPEDSTASNSTPLLCGDINQGLNSNLEVLQVRGHSNGMGLPDCFLVRDKRTGRVGEYTFNDA